MNCQQIVAFKESQMKKWLLFFLFVATFVFSEEYLPESYYQEGSDVADELFVEFAQKVCKKYDLGCEGNSGSFPKKIESLGGYFATRRFLKIEELRSLELQLIKEYQDLINQNPKIRKFLADYPFPADRIGISVSLYEDKKSPPIDELDRVFSCRGKLIYRLSASNDVCIFDSKRVEEKIEEACSKAGIEIPNIRSEYSRYQYGDDVAKITDW